VSFSTATDDFTQNNLLIAPNMRAVILVGYRKTLAFPAEFLAAYRQFLGKFGRTLDKDPNPQEVESDTEAHKD